MVRALRSYSTSGGSVRSHPKERALKEGHEIRHSIYWDSKLLAINTSDSILAKGQLISKANSKLFI